MMSNANRAADAYVPLTASALLVNPVGLHARPSVKLTQLAKGLPQRSNSLLAADGPVDGRKESRKGDCAMKGAGREPRCISASKVPTGEAALAAMLALVHDGFWRRSDTVAEIHLIGRAASPGLAIGPVTVLTASVARRTASEDPAQEAAALAGSDCRREGGDRRRQIKTIQGEVGRHPGIPGCQCLEDDALADPAYEVIAAGVSAADHAWRLALDVEIEGLIAPAEDEYFRASWPLNIVDIRDRVLAHLSGRGHGCQGHRWLDRCGLDDHPRLPPFSLAADWSHGGAIPALAAGPHLLRMSRCWHGARGGADGRPGSAPLSWNGQPPAAGTGSDGEAGTVIFDPEPARTRRLFEQRMVAANACAGRPAEAGSLAPACTADGRAGSRFCSTSPLLEDLAGLDPSICDGHRSSWRTEFLFEAVSRPARTRTRNMRVYRAHS